MLRPDALFQFASIGALCGWAVLLISPLIPKWADRISGLVIPLLFACAYSGLILAFWTSANGGFGSLQAVSDLFQTREILLAGWIHYLAFDLFVGAWIVRIARADSVPFWMVVPCLALTFLFGPAGFLLFNVLRAARSRSWVSA